MSGKADVQWFIVIKKNDLTTHPTSKGLYAKVTTHRVKSEHPTQWREERKINDISSKEPIPFHVDRIDSTHTIQIYTKYV